MKKLLENIKSLWHGSKYHTLSILFTFPFTLFGNIYNWMAFRDVMFNQIKGSQYVVQIFLVGFITYWVAYAIEIKQIGPGNNTEPSWRKYARPDIWVATALGVIGSIMAIIIYVVYY